MAKGFKQDREAQILWQGAYAGIPKSVFAVACWHLAELCQQDDGAPGRFIEEINALCLNGCITDAQAKRSIDALRNAFGVSA